MGIFDFLGGNPADEADEYFKQIPGQIGKYFDPYIEAGKGALPGLQDQYGRLIGNPGGRLNEIGQGYQQSPGFKFALQQALQGSGHAAAAGGMAGSPAHEQQSMGLATNLANQDYNNWISNALGLYGAGLQGQQGLYNTGANAGMRAGENLASNLSQRGQYAYAGQAGQNARNSDFFNNLLGSAAFAFL